MKYVTRSYWCGANADESDLSMTADQVIDTDKSPEPTGLLDHNGDKIYRVRDTVDFGFKVR